MIKMSYLILNLLNKLNNNVPIQIDFSYQRERSITDQTRQMGKKKENEKEIKMLTVKVLMVFPFRLYNGIQST